MNKLKQISFSAILLFFLQKIFPLNFPQILFYKKISDEDCYNGIDDDGDGLIDLDDPDCFCEEATYLATNLISNPSFTYTTPGCTPTFSGCYALNSIYEGCIDGWMVIDSSISFYGVDYFTRCYSYSCK